MGFLRWAKGFFEQGSPQSSARLIAIGGFVVGCVIAFLWPDRLHLIGMFVVTTAVGITLRKSGPPGGPPPDAHA